MQNHLWVEANIQVTVNSHDVKEYRVSQKNSALALLQQQANALFLLGYPVLPVIFSTISISITHQACIQTSSRNFTFKLRWSLTLPLVTSFFIITVATITNSITPRLSLETFPISTSDSIGKVGSGITSVDKDVTCAAWGITRYGEIPWCFHLNFILSIRTVTLSITNLLIKNTFIVSWTFDHPCRAMFTGSVTLIYSILNKIKVLCFLLSLDF